MIILLLLIAILALVTLGVQLYTSVPPFPSTQKEVEAVVKLLRSHPLRDGPVVELGCGWGTLLVALAKAFPERAVVGIELSPLPAFVAWIRSFRYPNMIIYCKNFFHYDACDAAAVTCYLMMGPMPKVAEKLDRELEADTPVVAIAFHFRDRTPVAEIEPSGVMPGGVALYRW